jgi:hypothetical protein
MTEDDFDAVNDEAHPDPDHDHEHDLEEGEEALEDALEMDTQSQIFLEMRQQNLDLLRIAIEVAGYTGQHPPLKSDDVKKGLHNIWEIFSEFYSWIDPEELEGDDDDDDDDDENADDDQ